MLLFVDVIWIRLLLVLIGVVRHENAATASLRDTIELAPLEENPGSVTKDGLSQPQKTSLLQLHNAFRSIVKPTATNMLRMTWDDELESIAATFAAKCIVAHNPDRHKQARHYDWVGENIAWGTGLCGDKECGDIYEGVKRWFSESKNYNFITGQCSGKCTLYTQMAWWESSKLGCGAKRCGDRTILVCNYAPGGNYVGQKPYRQGKSCTDCPKGSICDNNLCVPPEQQGNCRNCVNRGINHGRQDLNGGAPDEELPLTQSNSPAPFPLPNGWKQLPVHLIQIDSGMTHDTWGLGARNTPFYLELDNVLTQVNGTLHHVTAGGSGVWGIGLLGNIFIRMGVSEEVPRGVYWEKIRGNLKQVDSGPAGVVWGVNRYDRVFCRIGISVNNPAGTGWQLVPGNLKYISCGAYGCWGTDKQGTIFFRKGVSSENPQGDEWMVVQGSLRMVESGPEGVTVGVRESPEGVQDVLYRSGVTQAKPEGTHWEKMESKLSHVTVGLRGIMGIMHDGTVIVHRDLKLAPSQPTSEPEGFLPTEAAPLDNQNLPIMQPTTPQFHQTITPTTQRPTTVRPPTPQLMTSAGMSENLNGHVQHKLESAQEKDPMKLSPEMANTILHMIQQKGNQFETLHKAAALNMQKNISDSLNNKQGEGLVTDGQSKSQGSTESPSKQPQQQNSAESSSKQPQQQTSAESLSKQPQQQNSAESPSKQPQQQNSAVSPSKQPQQQSSVESQSKQPQLALKNLTQSAEMNSAPTTPQASQKPNKTSPEAPLQQSPDKIPQNMPEKAPPQGPDKATQQGPPEKIVSQGLSEKAPSQGLTDKTAPQSPPEKASPQGQSAPTMQHDLPAPTTKATSDKPSSIGNKTMDKPTVPPQPPVTQHPMLPALTKQETKAPSQLPSKPNPPLQQGTAKIEPPSTAVNQKNPQLTGAAQQQPQLPSGPIGSHPEGTGASSFVGGSKNPPDGLNSNAQLDKQLQQQKQQPEQPQQLTKPVQQQQQLPTAQQQQQQSKQQQEPFKQQQQVPKQQQQQPLSGMKITAPTIMPTRFANKMAPQLATATRPENIHHVIKPTGVSLKATPFEFFKNHQPEHFHAPPKANDEIYDIGLVGRKHLNEFSSGLSGVTMPTQRPTPKPIRTAPVTPAVKVSYELTRSCCAIPDSVCPIPRDCTGYIECKGYSGFYKVCERGKMFHPFKNICDFPRNVDCENIKVGGTIATTRDIKDNDYENLQGPPMTSLQTNPSVLHDQMISHEVPHELPPPQRSDVANTGKTLGKDIPQPRISMPTGDNTGVLREVWFGLGLSPHLKDLIKNPRFPESPDEYLVLDKFEAPPNAGDGYGQRLSTYYKAPESGEYSFTMACDNECELWISPDTDELKSKMSLELKNGHFTSFRQWEKFPSEQLSHPVTLEQGKFYFIESFMKEGTGGDNLSIGVRLPGGRSEMPIVNNLYLIPASVTSRSSSNQVKKSVKAETRTTNSDSEPQYNNLPVEENYLDQPDTIQNVESDLDIARKRTSVRRNTE